MQLTNPTFWGVIFFLLGSGMQLGGYQNKPLAWACIAAAFLFVLYALFQTIALPGKLRTKGAALLDLRFSGKIPLHVAAQLAYEGARKNKTLWAEAAERMGTDSSPAGILDYVATYFGLSVPIWGRRPPSALDELIDSKLASRGTFTGGARHLEIANSAAVFTELWVNARDVSLVRDKMAQKVFPDGRC